MFKKSGADIVHRILSESGQTLAFAESLTTGNLQALIGARSGASKYFKGGITAYTIPIKADLLNVDPIAAASCDAVSAEIAVQMARGVCELFGADFGVATTGYAEPYPEQSVSVPHAYVAVYSAISEKSEFCDMFRGEGLSRRKMQMSTADYALRALAEVLENTVT